MTTDIVSGGTFAASSDICRVPDIALAFHRARKERLKRIAARAVMPVVVPPVVAPPPLPAPEEQPSVCIINRFGRVEHLSDDAIREINERIRAIRPISIATIQTEVCKAHGITREIMLGKIRTVPLTLSRHIAIYLSKQLTPFGLPEIGRRFGGRDHTTVLHAIRRISQIMREDSAFAAEIERLTSSILGERETFA